MSTPAEHEEAFIRRFVNKKRKGRLLELRKSERGWKVVLKELHGTSYLDEKWVVPIPAWASAADIVRWLYLARAPRVAYVFSRYAYAEGAFVPIEEAVEQSFLDSGMVISCKAGELAYCAGEDAVPRVIVMLRAEELNRMIGEEVPKRKGQQ